MYQIAYVIVKAAISPRPGNWILERSVDGETFSPWQYFAISNEECWTKYGLQASHGNHAFQYDSEVICTSYFSRLKPLEGGEVSFSFWLFFKFYQSVNKLTHNSICSGEILSSLYLDKFKTFGFSMIWVVIFRMLRRLLQKCPGKFCSLGFSLDLGSSSEPMPENISNLV